MSRLSNDLVDIYIISIQFDFRIFADSHAYINLCHTYTLKYVNVTRNYFHQYPKTINIVLRQLALLNSKSRSSTYAYDQATTN